MKAFLYGVYLQWKLDIRSRTILITCYLVPLLFFALMGGIFSSVMPETTCTLLQSMTVFGVTMGALIGLPPTLVEIYGSDIQKVYRAGGVPVFLGLILTNLSVFLHLFLMSLILYAAAPAAFGAALPQHPGLYFSGLAILILVSLSIASILGLAVKDPSKTPMFSILVFLPSVLLSGIMFPAQLLPESLRTTGVIFPASWGYRLLTDGGFTFSNLCPLLWMLAAAVAVCLILARKVGK